MRVGFLVITDKLFHTYTFRNRVMYVGLAGVSVLETIKNATIYLPVVMVRLLFIVRAILIRDYWNLNIWFLAKFPNISIGCSRNLVTRDRTGNIETNKFQKLRNSLRMGKTNSLFVEILFNNKTV